MEENIMTTTITFNLGEQVRSINTNTIGCIVALSRNHNTYLIGSRDKARYFNGVYGRIDGSWYSEGNENVSKSLKQYPFLRFEFGFNIKKL
jgi:hypothetical protein